MTPPAEEGRPFSEVRPSDLNGDIATDVLWVNGEKALFDFRPSDVMRRFSERINTAHDARMEAFRKRIIKVIEAKKPTVCFDTNDAGYRQAVLDVLRGVKAVPL